MKIFATPKILFQQNKSYTNPSTHKPAFGIGLKLGHDYDGIVDVFEQIPILQPEIALKRLAKVKDTETLEEIALGISKFYFLNKQPYEPILLFTKMYDACPSQSIRQFAAKYIAQGLLAIDDAGLDRQQLYKLINERKLSREFAGYVVDINKANGNDVSFASVLRAVERYREQ